MSLLYVNENGAVIKKNGNRIEAVYKNGDTRSVPIETLESITILGSVQLTSQCMETCMTRGIPVAFFSKGGKYFGRLQSTSHINAERQRKQSKLYEAPFSLELAKILITAKLKNQMVVLRRYIKKESPDLSECIRMLSNCREKASLADNIDSLMGYEGTGARSYFKGLSQVIEPDFRFNGRSRRPPLDEFNSLISLGYTILMNEIYSAVEQKGLNPYFGFLHRDHENHPTLVSDLLEEWRAVLIDATVMSLINGHEIHKDDFEFDSENPGCFITKNGLKIFLNKLNSKLQSKMKYLPYVDYPVSFQQGILLQANALVHAIENQNADLYHPVEIR